MGLMTSGVDGGTVRVDGGTMRVDMPATGLTLGAVVEGEGLVHEPMTFDASSTSNPEAKPLTFQWSFEDGEVREGERVSHIFRTPGQKSVTLQLKEHPELQLVKTFTISEPVPQGTATVSGAVTDTEGVPIEGARLFDASATELGRTDAQGAFDVTLPRGIPLVVRIERAGWMPQLHRVRIPGDQDTWSLQSRMLRTQRAILLRDAQQGGTVTTGTGGSVSFPPEAFVDAQGAPIQGDVLVKMAPLDTSGPELEAFPGGFDAVRLEDGRQDVLASLGTMNMSLEQNGAQIFLDPAKRATLEIPLATEAPLGSNVPLWSLDPRSGLWLGQGEGEVVDASGSPTTRALRAQVADALWWNADVLIPTVTLPLKVQNVPSNVAIVFEVVTLEGREEARTRLVQRFLKVESIAEIQARFPKTEAPVSTSITSADGRHRAMQDAEPPTDEEREELLRSLTDLHVVDPTRGVWEVGLGEEIKVKMEEAGEEYYVGFEADAGDLVQLEVSGDFLGTAAVLPGSYLLKHRRSWKAGEPAKIITSFEKKGRQTLVLRSIGGQTGEVTVKANRADSVATALGQRVPVTVSSLNPKEWLVQLNAGQTLHATMYGPERVDGRFVLEYFGKAVSPRGVQYGPHSRSFTTQTSGTHVLRWTPSAAAGAPATFTLSLQEILPAQPIALSPQGPITLDPQSMGAGEVREYRFVASREESVFMEALPQNLSPDATLGASVEAKIQGFPSTVPADASADQHAVLVLQGEGGAEEEKDYLFGIHLDQGEATVVPRFDRLAPFEGRLKVGSCAEAKTALLALAAAASKPDATLDLCPGMHQSFSGLKFGGTNLSLEGAGADQTFVAGWDGAPLGPAFVSQFKGVSIDMASTQGLFMESDRDNPAQKPLVVEQVKLTQRPGIGRQGTIGISMTDRGTLKAGEGRKATIKEVVLEGQYEKGLRIFGFEGVGVEEVTMDGLGGVGLEVLNSSQVQVQGGSWKGVTQAIRAFSGSLPMNLSVSQATFETLATGAYGIELADGDASTFLLEDSTLTHQGRLPALGVRPSGNGFTMEMRRNMLGCLGSCPYGLQVSAATGNAQTFTIVNNVMVNFGTAIDLQLGGQGSKAELVHNSFRSDTSVSPIRAMVRLAVSAMDLAAVYLENNLFVGGGVGRDVGIELPGLTPKPQIVSNLFSNVLAPYRVASSLAPLDPQDKEAAMLELADLLSLLPLPSSPVVHGAISTPRTPRDDVMGRPRPNGPAPDIGAHELQLP